MTLIRNRPTAEGHELGRHLAHFADEAEPRARLKWPEMPPRCASCAFREGPHVANGSPATQMDALKCVMEGVEFQCHEPPRAGQPCSGWLMLQLGSPSDGIVCPWPFSDEMGAEGGQDAE